MIVSPAGVLVQPRSSPINQSINQSSTQAVNPAQLSLAPSPINTNGPPPPSPSLSATPASDFAQLILTPPRPISQQVRDQLAVKRAELLERSAREYAINERKYRKNREDKQRSYERSRRSLQQLREKAAHVNEEKELENPPKRRLFASFADGGDERIARLKSKVLRKLGELDVEKRAETEHDMDHDDRQTLLTLSAYFPCDWSIVGTDPSAIPSLLSGLSTHSGECDVVARVLQHIACLFVTTAGAVGRPLMLQSMRTVFYDKGGVSLCVNAMLDHPSILQIQAYGLCILFALSSHVSFCEAMINCGVIPAACCAMNAHPQSFIISNTGPALLSRVCHHNPSVISFVLQSDGVNLTLNAMSGHANDVGIHLHALHCLHQLVGSFSSREQLEALDSRVLESVITTAYTFMKHSAVQLACLTLLDMLCRDSIDCTRLATKNSGIQMTMLILPNHPDNAELIELAFRFLERIEWQRLECQQALLPVDAFKLLARCITRYSASHSTLVTLCIRITSLMLEHASIQPIAPLQAGLLAALLNCVKQQSSEQIHANVALCLQFLSFHDINKLPMINSGVVQSIQSMLKTSPVCAVADHTTAALAYLSDHPDPQVRRRLIQTLLTESVIQLALRIMEQHSPNVSITEHCVCCLFNILNVSTVPVVNQFVSCNGISQLISACRDHSTSEIVQRFCISIFSILSALMDEKELFLKMHAESISCILIAMRNYPSSLNVLCQSLVTLRNLTNKFDCGSVKSAEIIDQVLIKLKAFPDSVYVSQYSAELMWNLALIDPLNLAKLRNSEAVSLMLSSRRAHLQNVAVKHATSGLLDVLECSIEEEGADRNAPKAAGELAASVDQGEIEHGERSANVVQGEADPQPSLFIPSPRSATKFAVSEQASAHVDEAGVMPLLTVLPPSQPAHAVVSPFIASTNQPGQSRMSTSVSAAQPSTLSQSIRHAHSLPLPNVDPHHMLMMEIQSIIARMQTDQLAQSLLYCCDRLCELAALHPTSHGLVAVHGGIQVLIQTLRNHPVSISNAAPNLEQVHFSVEELIQIAGLNTLARLSASSVTLMLEVSRHGGLIVALNSIESRCDNPLVAENALSLINQAIAPNTQSINPMVSTEKRTNISTLLRANAIALIVACMMQHESVLSVQQQALQALLHFIENQSTTGQASNQSNDQIELSEQCITHLCTCVHSWLYDEVLCESALTLLCYAARTPYSVVVGCQRFAVQHFASSVHLTYRHSVHICSLTDRLLTLTGLSIQPESSDWPVGPLSPGPGAALVDHGGPPIDRVEFGHMHNEDSSVHSEDESDSDIESEGSERNSYSSDELHEEGQLVVTSASRSLFHQLNSLAINSDENAARPADENDHDEKQPHSQSTF